MFVCDDCDRELIGVHYYSTTQFGFSDYTCISPAGEYFENKVVRHERAAHAFYAGMLRRSRPNNRQSDVGNESRGEETLHANKSCNDRGQVRSKLGVESSEHSR